MRPIYIADAALYLKSAKPELGIQNPYELTETQYKAVLDLLRAQQPLIHRYWHDATVQMSDFKNEGVAASSSWGYMVNGLQADKQPVASTIPKEVPAACKESELLGAEGCKTNGFDTFDKIAFWKTPQAEGGKFVPYSRWTQDYIAIMGGR